MGIVYTAKYAPGDSVYYPLFATATIYVCTVDSMYFKDSTVYYNIIRKDRDFLIPDVPEDQVMSFTDAKTVLSTYLSSKLASLNNLTA